MSTQPLGSEDGPSATDVTRWRWGLLRFEGLMGLHGCYLCFHRFDATDGTARVDPAKPMIRVDASLAKAPETAAHEAG